MMIFHWPQVVLVGLMIMNLTFHLANDGEPKGNYNFFYGLLDAGIIMALLYAGGFFG